MNAPEPPFELEVQTPGHVPPSVVEELRTGRAMTAPVPAGVVAKFLRGVGPMTESGCRLWLRGTGNHGYGQIGNGGGKMLAHRVSWLLHYGAIPDEMCVLHRCDVRRCVAIAHLFLGTKADNSDDRCAKGRSAVGEQSGNAKLTEADVESIRKTYVRGKITQQSLADKYGVSYSQISQIVNHKRWAHSGQKRGNA